MKIIKPILISLIGLLTVSCGEQTEIDYDCRASYQLENQTDKEIYVKRTYSKFEEQRQLIYLYAEYTIPPSKTKEIDRIHEPCTQEEMIEYLNNEVLLIVSRNISVEVYADERQLNETLLDKINWEVTTTNDGKVIFLLVVTDELIESVGYKSE